MNDILIYEFSYQYWPFYGPITPLLAAGILHTYITFHSYVTVNPDLLVGGVPMRKALRYIWVIAALVFSILLLRELYLLKKYYGEDYRMTEGCIEQHYPQRNPREGAYFVVNGERFHYSTHEHTFGYNGTSGKTELVRKGACVRIKHIGNIILKFEFKHWQ